MLCRGGARVLVRRRAAYLKMENVEAPKGVRRRGSPDLGSGHRIAPPTRITSTFASDYCIILKTTSLRCPEQSKGCRTSRASHRGNAHKLPLPQKQTSSRHRNGSQQAHRLQHQVQKDQAPNLRRKQPQKTHRSSNKHRNSSMTPRFAMRRAIRRRNSYSQRA